MSILKSITLESGLVVSYHKILAIGILNNAGQETVSASIASWVDATFAEKNPQSPTYRMGAVLSFPPQSGMYALAEAAIVADPTSKLFGGTVTPDVTQTDLDKAKNKKKAEIASAKNVEMYADKTTSLGTFGSSESDNNRLSIAIQIAQLSPAQECGYKDASGNWQMYTVAQLTQIALEIANQVLPLYEKEAILSISIEAAATVEELELIGW